MQIFPPGSTIGILGGGQLGRMTAMAAARLGYHTHIFCSDAHEPAIEVAQQATIAAFDDAAALTRFAAAVDVITLEWENVPVATLELLARLKPVHPKPAILAIAQDRIQEKTFARQQGIGTADFLAVNSAAELAAALQTIQPPCILKSTRLGYDGKGQVKIMPGMAAADAWQQMGSSAGILEAIVDFDCEVSVIVARRGDGQSQTYPVVRNRHHNGILAETNCPAMVTSEIEQEALALATRIADRLELVGLLAVEMFVLKTPNAAGQRVLLNEIAPRPHNSGHWTMDACACSQFEQLVRAVCGLPLGDTTPHSRSRMRNLLGEDVTQWADLLAKPQTCLHLYGKGEARAGRKMGHVNELLGPWKS
jgi:5-(carboxyamino)imidazole ribonucleotide synthase